MKSQRRHELQHNTLDAELATIVDFFRNHWSKLLLAVAIIAVAVMAIVTYTSRRSDELADIESQYARLKIELVHRRDKDNDDLLRRLKDLASQRRVPRIAAMACVDIGNIYAADADKADKADDDRLRQAAKYYNLAVSAFTGQKTAAAKAHLGLARLAESSGRFDEAREQYKAVRDVPGQPVAAIAAAGRKGLKNLLAKVRLAATRPAGTASRPSGPPQAASAPTTMPK